MDAKEQSWQWLKAQCRGCNKNSQQNTSKSALSGAGNHFRHGKFHACDCKKMFSKCRTGHWPILCSKTLLRCAKHRWEAIHEETNEMENAKLNAVRCKPKKYKKTEKQRRKSCLEVDSCCLSPLNSGHQSKNNVLLCFLNYIQILRRHRLLYTDWKWYMPHHNRLAVQN